MNKFLRLTFFAAVLFFVTTSCMARKYSDDRVTWTVPVGSFTEIVENSSIDVEYVESDSYGVTVKAPNELRQYVSISVKGNTLYVSMKQHRGIYNFKRGVDVIVKTPKLNSVKLSGSGDFEAKSLTANALYLFTNGSGDISIGNVYSSGEITATTSGSGDIRIEKISCKSDLALLTRGSGDIIVSDAAVGNVSMKTTGSGDIKAMVKTSGSVTATSTGSGDIHISGSASSLRERSTGSGDIHSKGLKTM